MDKRVKALWIEALRSGKYQQGQAYLSRDNKYCCLGVLCELAVQENIIKPPRVLSVRHDTKIYDGETEFQSSLRFLNSASIQEWAGLINQHNTLTTLMRLNDRANYNFNEIADYIETHL